ncbi:MAG: stage III sporulation protein AE [Cellulosilyticaceae bacterium]
MQKKIIYIVMIALMWLGVVSLACASEADVSKNEVIETQINMLDWNAIEEVQARLQEQIPAMKGFNLKEEVKLIVSGEKEFSLQEIVGIILDMLFKEMRTYVNVIARFILIVIMCNLLSKLSASFNSKEITKFAFFVCYILIIYSVVQSLVTVVDLAHTTIGNLRDMMLVALPTLLAFMAVSGYIASSAALAPIIMAALNMIAFFIQKLVLPSIVSVVILQIISSMSEEFKIDKLIGLFYKGSKWVLRSILILSIGIMGAYNVVLPALDVTMKRVGMKLGTKFIPVIGDAVGGAIEFIVRCSGLIKNAFALGIIMWIILIVAIPLIKIITYIFLYNIAAAVIEPLGDSKMSKIATNLAKGCEFVMSCVGIVALLSIVTMVICMSVGATGL